MVKCSKYFSVSIINPLSGLKEMEDKYRIATAIMYLYFLR